MPHSTSPDTPPTTATNLLIRAPQQERSRRTLRRILDTSLDILETDGPDALTVTAITKRARASVGSFYARFEGKDDLLRYMGERALENALAEWARMKKDDLPSKRKRRRTLRFLVSRLGRLYMRGPARAIVLLDGLEDPAPTRRERLEALIVKDAGDLLDFPDIRKTLAARVLTGVLHDATLRHIQAAEAYPEPSVLLPELLELLVGYLGGKVRPPEGDPKVPEVEYAPYRPAGPEVAEPEPTPEPTPDPPEPEPVPVTAETAEPATEEPQPEPEPEPDSESEDADIDSEPPTDRPEPDPFDVWG